MQRLNIVVKGPKAKHSQWRYREVVKSSAFWSPTDSLGAESWPCHFLTVPFHKALDPLGLSVCKAAVTARPLSPGCCRGSMASGTQ